MCLADCESSYLVPVIGRISNGLDGASFVLNGIVYNVSGITSGWDKVLLYAVFVYYAPISKVGGEGH